MILLKIKNGLVWFKSGNPALYLINRLKKLSRKYEKVFNEKLTIYDNIIRENIKEEEFEKADIEQINNNKFIKLGNEYNYIINNSYFERLNKRIYNWFVDEDHLLLKFMTGRGSFRKDIPGLEKCVLCKVEDNGIEHVINLCNELEEERKELLSELNILDNKTRDMTLLDAIYYWYYSKELDKEKKKDLRGIKLIKEFLFTMYKKFGEKGAKDKEDEDIQESEYEEDNK